MRLVACVAALVLFLSHCASRTTVKRLLLTKEGTACAQSEECGQLEVCVSSECRAIENAAVLFQSVAQPQGLTATQGSYADRVELAWNAIEGVSTYAVFRDNISVAEVSRNFFLDYGATAPALLAAPSGATASTDRAGDVRVSWPAVLSVAGASHVYSVIALGERGLTSYPSVGVAGFRQERPTGYELSIDGGAAIAVAGNEFLDSGAGEDVLVLPKTYVSQLIPFNGPTRLSMDLVSVGPGPDHHYRVRAVGLLGKSPDSQEATGHRAPARSVAEYTYKWQRSLTDADADYADIAMGRSALDSTIAQGSAHYYRAVVQVPLASDIPLPSTRIERREFNSVHAFGAEACGIDTLSRASCWGLITGATAPTGVALTSTVATTLGGFGLGSDGAIYGWRLSAAFGPTGLQIPAGADFIDLQANASSSPSVCGLHASGGLQCIGNGSNSAPSGPTDSFKQVSLGYAAGCAIKTSDDTLVCWRDQSGSAASVVSGKPAKKFRQVGVGRDHACGWVLDTMTPANDKTIDCWGTGVTAPSGSYELTRIVSGSGQTCLMKVDGSTACFGPNSGAVIPSDLRSLSLFQGGGNGPIGARCYVTSDGNIECKGSVGRAVHREELPSMPAAKLIGSFGGGCGLSQSGDVSCWGRDDFAQLAAGVGPFIAGAKSQYDTCFVTAGNVLRCAGRSFGLTPLVTAANYKEVSLDLFSNVLAALRLNGDRVSSSGPLSTHPPDAATIANASVSTLVDSFNFIATDGRLNAALGTTPYTSASPACGVRASDSRLECFGDNEFGESPPGPTKETFLKVIDLGSFLTCALRADHHIRCFGSSPPTLRDEEYSDIGSWEGALCAIRSADSRIICFDRMASLGAAQVAGAYP